MGILYEVRDGMAIITINRPEARNALDPETSQELGQAWLRVRDDPQVGVAIITGAGEKAFCAGGDMRKRVPHLTEEVARTWDTGLLHILKGVDLWKPVIAAINGYCYAGGLEMLAGTDIRIAAEHAKFAVAEVRHGIFPRGGIAVRLPRQVPYCWAMEMLLVGHQGGGITAEQAYHMGLVNRVVPLKDLMPTAIDFAQRILANGPLAVQAIKRTATMTSGVPLQQAYFIDTVHADVVQNSADAREGIRAFNEKRKPQWRAR